VLQDSARLNGYGQVARKSSRPKLRKRKTIKIMKNDKIFKVREKSGNFTSSQEKVKSLKEVREK